MNGTVYVRKYELPTVDKDEVLRYMGVRVSDEKTEELTVSCIEECEKNAVFTPSVCYAVFDMDVSDGAVEFGGLQIKSNSLSSHFKGCEKLIVFAGTVGIGIDRFIEKYSRLSASKALCFGSIGAQRIEELCDAFCKDMKDEFSQMNHTSRFSPGYGDLDISLQNEIFRLLDCPKKIGLSLCDSFIMSPSKSVTALIGLASKELTK